MRLRCVLLFLLVLALTMPLSAKGPTTKLVVTGPGIATPIEVTSPAAIAPSVYGGEFFGRPVSAPPVAWTRYTVTFHLLPPRETTPRAMYQVQFVRDPLSADAFVYLPAPTEPAGQANRHTISREGQDGHWYRAAPAWGRAVAAALAHSI